MGLVTLVGELMLWATVAAAPERHGGKPAGLPEPIHTRQTLFAIPFQMTGTSQPTQAPLRVLLYVSTNRGATWELTSQTEPAKRQFLFRAGSDGEFWFVIRTAIGSMPAQPQAGERPGLRVVVDTTPPKLDMVAERGVGGQLTARWQIAEANLKPDSLKVQYRVGGEQPWQTVAVDRMPEAAPGLNHTGEATWWEAGATQRVEIRGEVADLAGNTAVSHTQLSASLGLGGLTRPRPAPDSPPAADRSAPPRPSGLPQLNAPGETPRTRLPSSAWRAVRHSSRDPSETGGTQESSGDAASQSGASAGAFRADSLFSERSAPGAAIVPNQSPSARLVGARRGPAEPGSAKDLEAGPRLRVVHALSFALDFDLGGTEPGPDEQVEFWGTRDGGRTWVSYGTSLDHRSPMAISVSEEGLYGFRIGLHRTNDTQTAAPPSGTPPDLWVVVRSGDSPAVSPPVSPARILDARPTARPGQPPGL